jgi:hypothetical protein
MKSDIELLSERICNPAWEISNLIAAVEIAFGGLEDALIEAIDANNLAVVKWLRYVTEERYKKNKRGLKQIVEKAVDWNYHLEMVNDRTLDPELVSLLYEWKASLCKPVTQTAERWR